MSEHGEQCIRPLRGACLGFSTDGTRLGADIAHEMGTTDEDDIIMMSFQQDKEWLTGMDEEQADWDAES